MKKNLPPPRSSVSGVEAGTASCGPTDSGGASIGSLPRPKASIGMSNVSLTVKPILAHRLLELSPEPKRHGTNQKQKRDSVIPFESFAEVDPRENRENSQRDYLLDDL